MSHLDRRADAIAALETYTRYSGDEREYAAAMKLLADLRAAASGREVAGPPRA